MPATHAVIERHGIRTETRAATADTPELITLSIPGDAAMRPALTLTAAQAAELLAQLAWHLHRTEIR